MLHTQDGGMQRAIVLLAACLQSVHHGIVRDESLAALLSARLCRCVGGIADQLDAVVCGGFVLCNEGADGCLARVYASCRCIFCRPYFISPSAGMLMHAHLQHTSAFGLSTACLWQVQPSSAMSDSAPGPGAPAPPAAAAAGASASSADQYGLLGLLTVISMSDADVTTLALGTDLTTLGLHLNGVEPVYDTFASPWADYPLKPDPDFKVALHAREL